jgi:hypothetical protein
MVARASLILLCLGVYQAPNLIGEMDDFQHLSVNAISSAFLAIYFFWLSYRWWAQLIVLIEIFLLMITASIVYGYNGGITPVEVYYPQIQKTALILELVILAFSGWRFDNVAHRGSSNRNSLLNNRDWRNQRGGSL